MAIYEAPPRFDARTGLNWTEGKQGTPITPGTPY